MEDTFLAAARVLFGREPTRLECRGIGYLMSAMARAWADGLVEAGDPPPGALVEVATLEYLLHQDAGGPP